MRSFLLSFAITLLAVSALRAQSPGTVAEAPSGTNWIADRETRRYYPVDCPAAAGVPVTARLYYATEAALREAGYARSTDCPGPGLARLQDAPPRLQDAPAQSPRAQTAVRGRHARQGFWFNGGLGFGSLGCDDCGGREGSLSGGLALGGTLGPKVLLGGGTTGWTKSEGGVTLTVGTLVALIRFYPSSTGGFFLLGGLGLGTIHAQVDGFGSESETGAGALLGLGYDIRVGRNVSLTPFWNGFAVRTSDADANVGQLGLGMTLH